MAQQARASKAEGTWRAYGSDWQIWEAWAAANGATAMPADPGRVAEFLSDMTVTRKLSTVRRYLASISVSHTLKGHQFERKHPSIKTILSAPGHRFLAEFARRRQAGPRPSAETRDDAARGAMQRCWCGVRLPARSCWPRLGLAGHRLWR
jgi:hypothetical protein